MLPILSRYCIHTGCNKPYQAGKKQTQKPAGIKAPHNLYYI